MNAAARPSDRRLTGEDVDREAALHGHLPGCARCLPFASRGWESFPSTASDKALQLLGSLRDPQDDDPTLEELHDAATSLWSPQAPIALHFHPYNRSELWACRTCHKPFLRYTEYGGYYEEQRIRELQPGLITHAMPGDDPAR
ncbi:hypothetical protein QTI66_02050 [Variovorax sp. J22R133]|uniref:hypothetical protein n=1 Tax=Variovorax brevis TaxID=3053503 RepID=UPI0025751217|nr:hypothetical protein [Variovorax sp. J22R133]MDM0110909.1 hypothetical protein [Variovorax sp. J22R133]